MIGTVQKYYYTAYGFTIACDFPHPGFAPRTGDEGPEDVTVTIGDLSSLWSEWAAPDQKYVCEERFIMFQIPEAATYLVTGGNQIIVHPMEGANPVRVRLFLDGYCMAMILLQRNILPLHGSAVAIDGKAYAIIGRSGAGKSTLTKAFLERGYSFLCDDVIPIDFTHESGQVMVSPAFPEQKLWEESLEGFGMESGTYNPIYEQEQVDDPTGTRRRRTKFAIPVSHYAAQPMPLAGIFELEKTGLEEETGVYPLHKSEQLRAVTHHTFHRSLIVDLGMQEWHFKTTVELVNRMKIQKVKRSKTSFSVPELVSSILELIGKEQV